MIYIDDMYITRGLVHKDQPILLRHLRSGGRRATQDTCDHRSSERIENTEGVAFRVHHHCVVFAIVANLAA